jgi:hypothetical protein
MFVMFKRSHFVLTGLPALQFPSTDQDFDDHSPITMMPWSPRSAEGSLNSVNYKGLA